MASIRLAAPDFCEHGHMTAEEALRIQRASQRAFFRDVVGHHGTAEPGGSVFASYCAAVPERSLPNSVVYDDPHDLTDEVLDALARVYDEAGVRAWTVWVPPGDEVAAEVLVRRGHQHDAMPMLMAGVLAEMDLEPRREVELDPDPQWATVGDLNDRAYGLPGDFSKLVQGVDDPSARLWIAREDGEPVACVVIKREDGDAWVGCVATLPEARGKGLCGELMRRGLAAARDGGARTTTLEATQLGQGVYTSVGYGSFGRYGMWEHRV